MFPEAKFVFPVRNPLDVAASIKRRRSMSSAFVGTRWARTIRLAERRQREWPDNSMILRYEDIVSRPGEVLRRLFSFLDLRWDERYIDIPHVNRSETPFNLEGDARGINQTRVFTIAAF